MSMDFEPLSLSGFLSSSSWQLQTMAWSETCWDSVLARTRWMRSAMSSVKSLRSDNWIGTVHCSFLNQISLCSVSMHAPSPLNTLFAIRKGVFDGTAMTFNQWFPIGMNTARVPVTVASFPKRKFTAHGDSFMWRRVSEGRLAHKSLSCCSPITERLAPKSTIPWDPCDTKKAAACFSEWSTDSSWFAEGLRVRHTM